MPVAVARLAFAQTWVRSSVLMMAIMIVDVDHLLADPIYDAQRCSIGFHPLHEIPVIGLYAAACFLPKSRVVGVGLLIHMGLDSFDCMLNGGIWFVA